MQRNLAPVTRIGKTPAMTLKPLGDCAWLAEFPGLTGEAALARVMGLAAALEVQRPAAVLDVVASFDSLAVHFAGGGGSKVLRWIQSAAVVDQLPQGAEIQIPVCYGGEHGPDLDEVAEKTGLSADEVIALHSGAVYTVAAVGFSPGFPYLLGLPECLRVPRRGTPRLAVPAGSVAIAGGQAGIYPFASPGGWQVLGRTAVSLFDPSLPRPALLRSGDRVRFVAVDRLEMFGKISSPAEPAGPRWIEVIQPGALTTVQDLGRPGYESYGVSPGGAVDPQALRMANLLVGNPQNAAALELCVTGPILKFSGETAVALVGATGKPRRIAAGETVDFTKLTGNVRACLAVSGGLRVPRLLGSMATDLRAGFGGLHGRALRAGDRLEFNEPGPACREGNWYVGRPERVDHIELRFTPGVQQHWFSEKIRRRFQNEIYRLTPQSDRMGARLTGAELLLTEPREMVSQPVARGSVQVPPDGQPIILLAERQTIGGYPQIGHVISVDLPKLARAWPGTQVIFREITREQAVALHRRAERDFKWLQTGLKLLT
ncbi:MAG: 5-oxoprolinase subunit PxpB [Luteolibacter sp.]